MAFTGWNLHDLEAVASSVVSVSEATDPSINPDPPIHTGHDLATPESRVGPAPTKESVDTCSNQFMITKC